MSNRCLDEGKLSYANQQLTRAEETFKTMYSTFESQNQSFESQNKSLAASLKEEKESFGLKLAELHAKEQELRAAFQMENGLIPFIPQLLTDQIHCERKCCCRRTPLKQN
jgi:hypothetical protein